MRKIIKLMRKGSRVRKEVKQLEMENDILKQAILLGKGRPHYF